MIKKNDSKKEKTKSPIKDKLLRLPGQSCDEEIDRLLNDKLMPHFVTCFIMMFIAIYLWGIFLFKISVLQLAIGFSLFSIIYAIIVARRISRTKKKIKLLGLGRDGERAVAEYIERLREKGFRIFHDIVGNGNFNLDHVIVSPKGIFIVETKTFSKPEKGEAKITITGEEIYLNDYKITDNPIQQVTASSAWLQNVLKESTGRDFTVRAAIVFPGWYVIPNNDYRKDIWFLNPKALPKFLDNENDIISKEDMMLAAYHISRYIRTK